MVKTSLRKKVISREQGKHVRTKYHNIYRTPSKQVFHIIVIKIIMIIIIMLITIIIIIITIMIMITSIAQISIYMQQYISTCNNIYLPEFANSAAVPKYKKPPSPPLCFGHTAANHPPTAQCGFTLIGDQKKTVI